MDYTLKKKYRLCGETNIAQLYKEGNAFLVFPIRVVYRTEKIRNYHNRPEVRILFSAPKKRFKHAVDRNYCKRLMRENYRLKQNTLKKTLLERNMAIDISLTIIHGKLPKYNEISESMEKILNNLILAIDKNNVDR